MVAEYGMSDKIGLVAAGAREPAQFLQGPGQHAECLAEETAREIDLEVKRLMADAYAVALSALRERRTAVAEISRHLIDRELVDGDEVRQMVSAGRENGVHAA